MGEITRTIMSSAGLPLVLCSIISEYYIDLRHSCLRLLQSSLPNGFIVYSSIGLPIRIISEASYKTQVLNSQITIRTNNKCNYRCRNFTRFWDTLMTKEFSRVKIFGRDYKHFENELLNCVKNLTDPINH